MKTLFKLLIFAWPVWLLLLPNEAVAARLEIADDAHWSLRLGADALLYTHILSGAVGIAAGFFASLSRKGQRLHRRSGAVFLYAMVICYVIAALVAPFLDTEQRTNFVAAILALYLLLTGREAANRRTFVAGTKEKVGLIVATAITFMGGYFIWLAQHSPTGTVDGAPPQAFILFVVAGSLALIGELRVLIAGQLSNSARIARHLWRMCMSFFIASGSLFFGQAAFFPDWFSTSLLPLLFGFFPLLIVLIGLIQTFKPIQGIKKRLHLHGS